IGQTPSPLLSSTLPLHLRLRTSSLIRGSQNIRDLAHELKLLLLLGDERGTASRRDREHREVREEVRKKRKEVGAVLGDFMGGKTAAPGAAAAGSSSTAPIPPKAGAGRDTSGSTRESDTRPGVDGALGDKGRLDGSNTHKGEDNETVRESDDVAPPNTIKSNEEEEDVSRVRRTGQEDENAPMQVDQNTNGVDPHVHVDASAPAQARAQAAGRSESSVPSPEGGSERVSGEGADSLGPTTSGEAVVKTEPQQGTIADKVNADVGTQQDDLNMGASARADASITTQPPSSGEVQNSEPVTTGIDPTDSTTTTSAGAAAESLEPTIPPPFIAPKQTIDHPTHQHEDNEFSAPIPPPVHLESQIPITATSAAPVDVAGEPSSGASEPVSGPRAVVAPAPETGARESHQEGGTDDSMDIDVSADAPQSTWGTTATTTAAAAVASNAPVDTLGFAGADDTGAVSGGGDENDDDDEFEEVS
ncbi:hypothetical protein I317_07414, partial [Kwoniella heveanensis CBS 569]